MSTKLTLEKARGLIEKPEDWRIDMLSTNNHAPYCALGAIMCASEWPRANWYGYATPEQNAAYEAAAVAVAEVIKPGSGEPDTVAHYNNTHSHDCVLAAFDAAIERAS